jgi:putative ABC transport system permease protein
VPGVIDAQCSMVLPQRGFGAASAMRRGDRSLVSTKYLPVDYGFFQLYGYELAAGRFFDRNLGSDETPVDNIWRTPEALLINETAARQLGFATPQAALGETVRFSHLFRLPAQFTPLHDAVIIGVLKDFQIGSVRDAVSPAAFYVDPGNFRLLSVKLDGKSTRETLQGIRDLWKERGEPGPAELFFFSNYIQNMYVDLRRQSGLFSVFAGIAILIAVLGLIGLAAHAAVSRTKEIGIRKSLGGGRWTITQLLLWQFAAPVLLANVVAWPAAYWAMNAWLGGFARRVSLDWWIFVGAAAVTLLVAVAAVLVHTWAMAGTRPVEALRYE